jgi:hypothetical protein
MRLVLLLMVLLFPLSGVSNEVKSIAYERINEILYFAEYEKKSPIAYLDITVDYSGNEEINVWISGPNPRELSIENGNQLALPLMTKDHAKLHQLNFDKSDDEVALSLKIAIDVPEEAISYRNLFSILDDMNNMIKRQAGRMSWFISDYDTLRFEFNSDATISFEDSNIARPYYTDKNNIIEIRFNRKIFNENPLVNMSKVPKSIVPLN